MSNQWVFDCWNSSVKWKEKPRYKLSPRKKTSLQFSIDNCSQESRAGSKTSFYNRFFEWRKFLKKKNNDSFDQSLHFAVNRSFKFRLFLFWLSCTFNKSYTWVENPGYMVSFSSSKIIVEPKFQGVHTFCALLYFYL